MTANNNANGSFVTGNSQLFGIFTANTVAVFNELRGGNVQATGALTITSDTKLSNNLTIDQGGNLVDALLITNTDVGEASYIYYRVNNINRWGAGRQAAGNNYQINRYNTAGTFQDASIGIDDGTGLVTIANGLTVTASGLTVTAGVTDFGANVDLGINNRLFLDDDSDSYIYASADDTVVLGSGGSTTTFNATAMTSQLNGTFQGGTLSVGINDSVPGILNIFGGGTTESSGLIRIYNNFDDDTNAEYWTLQGEDGTGDFIIGDAGFSTALRIDETTFLTTLANGLTITTSGASISGDITLTDGNILQDRGGDAAAANFTSNTDIGQASYFFYKVNNIDRWAVGRQAVGNNYQINRYNTAGVFQDVPLEVEDTTGRVLIANGLSVATQGITVQSGGIDVQSGVSIFSANIDLEGTARIILDADNDSDLYASADDTIVLRVGGAIQYQQTTTVADFQTNQIRTGGDIFIDTDTGDLRLGAGTSNVVANSSLVRLANSTVTFDIIKPTAAQVSNGNFFLAADSTWKEPLLNQGSTVTSGTTAQEVDSFVKATYRSGEYFFTVEDNAANSRSMAKVLVLHDNSTTNAYITEFGVVESNAALGSYSANCNATHVIVYFTPTVAATTVKHSRTLLPVA
jgi:hypothetical protein